MVRIRPLERGDLPGVSRLLRAHLPRAPHDEALLAATLLDDPLSDPEVPSLVADDGNGTVVGYIAAQVSPLRLDGRVVRAAYCSDLVVAPESRGGATGALLVGRLLRAAGATFSDGRTRSSSDVDGDGRQPRPCSRLRLAAAAPSAEVVRRSRAARRTTHPDFRRHVRLPVISAQALGPRLLKHAFPPLEPYVEGEDADGRSWPSTWPR
jgi:GNAT superfamily N-acetyltransferase